MSVDKTSLGDGYKERNTVVQLCAVLAKRLGYTVGWKADEAEPDWPVLYIELPAGQVSWHIPWNEAVITLPDYEGEWDGHTNEKKSARINEFMGAK